MYWRVWINAVFSRTFIGACVEVLVHHLLTSRQLYFERVLWAAHPSQCKRGKKNMQYTKGLFSDYFVNKGLKFFYHYILCVTPCFFYYCTTESRVNKLNMLCFYCDKASQLYSPLSHILIVSTDRRIEKYRLTGTYCGAFFCTSIHSSK